MQMLVPLHQALDQTYPKIWRTIAECIFIALDEPDTQRRVQQTLQITDVLRAELGGLQPYLPKGNDYDNAVQYRDLYTQFNGRNLPDLAAAWPKCTPQAGRLAAAAGPCGAPGPALALGARRVLGSRTPGLSTLGLWDSLGRFGRGFGPFFFCSARMNRAGPAMSDSGHLVSLARAPNNRLCCSNPN